MPFIYVLSSDDRELDLARAELWALTGCRAQGRLGLGRAACDISRAAYVSYCGELLAEAESLDALVSAVAALGLHSDDFRIDALKLPPKPKRARHEMEHALADVISGYPDLERPRERFLLVGSEGAWRFARLISEGARDDRRQADKPHNLSQALNARHARALVNLAAAPGDILLDPCCGSGTCLIEAEHMGVRGWGVDLSIANAFMAAGNLRHFGLPARIAVADARDLQGEFDAIVIDFPYGRVSHVRDRLYADVLNNLARRAFRLAVILGEPEGGLFASLSLEVLCSARVPERVPIRYFYLLRGRRPAEGRCPAPCAE